MHNQKYLYDTLMQNASLIDDNKILPEFLPESHNGFPVDVYSVQSQVFQGIFGFIVSGNILRYNNHYAIFIGDQPVFTSNMPFAFLKTYTPDTWLGKYLILHEFGHAKAGDVFEDNPQKIFTRQMSISQLPQNQAQKEQQQFELQADGWAADFLKKEAQSAGNKALVKLVNNEIKVKGIPTV